MASTHTSLDAAATERKARLAKLASLKRKQPPNNEDEESAISAEAEQSSTSFSDPTKKHLSFRNYDPESRGPKLGFEAPPVAADQETLEKRAARLAAETKHQEEKEETEKAGGKGIDLFDLQPRKPNWDLKRDLARKMEVLQQRTDNAVARLVRERLGEQKKKERRGDTDNVNNLEGRRGETTGSDSENQGLGGADLVEGIHIRERQEEQERKSLDDDEDFR